MGIYNPIVRDSDGATIRLDKQEAEQADTTALAKRVINVDSAGNVILTPETTFTQALDNNTNGQPDFIGFAAPGSDKSAAAWQIRKITYSGVFPTDIQFADGDALFNNVWNNRAGLSYS